MIDDLTAKIRATKPPPSATKVASYTSGTLAVAFMAFWFQFAAPEIKEVRAEGEKRGAAIESKIDRLDDKIEDMDGAVTTRIDAALRVHSARPHEGVSASLAEMKAQEAKLAIMREEIIAVETRLSRSVAEQGTRMSIQIDKLDTKLDKLLERDFLR
ncbi:MAG TPA: hypothetical protein VMY39_01805 [Planctomycetota bacterium]|nr:hypothetical protein [Planctomycetota bacterium]